MATNKFQLQIAGACSLAKALLGFILFTPWGVTAYIYSSYYVSYFGTLFSLIDLTLFLYIFLSLKKLLNSNYQQHGDDIIIIVLIITRSLITTRNILQGSLQPTINYYQLGSVYGVIAFIYSLSFILLGMKILKLDEDLYNVLSPFLIFLGLLLILPFNFPTGNLFKIVIYLLISNKFFRAAKDYNSRPD